VLNLKLFCDDIFYTGDALITLAAETEHIAEQFRRDKSSLDDKGCYYCFNVLRGLEDIGLEEPKKEKEIASVTGRHITSQDVFTPEQNLDAKDAAPFEGPRQG
jgi:hypothetical protein